MFGELKPHAQEFNRANARVQAGLLFLATVALVVPPAIAREISAVGGAFAREVTADLLAETARNSDHE